MTNCTINLGDIYYDLCKSLLPRKSADQNQMKPLYTCMHQRLFNEVQQ